MNYIRLMSLIARLSLIADEQGGGIPKGDAGLYLLCRLFVERLEARNPGIAFTAGFTDSISELRFLARQLPSPPATLAELDTELLK
jgi:hypothetical protein